MARLDRRTLFACAGALPLAWIFASRIGDRTTALVPDPDGVLDLPEGFSYAILQQRFSKMSDGFRVPGSFDSMACFDAGDGTLVLMRNHELDGNQMDLGPYFQGQGAPAEAYDREAPGGVTRLVLDAKTFAPLSSNLVLAGTLRNCSGGPSPGGWLTCEEIVLDGHGHVFSCPITASSVQPPQRIDGYGRFRHEAAHTDPKTLITYLTEDEPTSAFYRFVPSGSDPFEGSLEAMTVKGAKRAALTQMAVGQRLDVGWVPIGDPTAKVRPVREQARQEGAAVVVRGEGLWIHQDDIYFVSSAGGPYGLGQIFRLHAEGDGGQLELLAMGTEPDLLRAPDNIAVHPRGGVVMAEDGPGGDFLRGLDAEGRPFELARNAKSDSELSGVCFSPKGDALFVNLQHDGMTLVIRGPLEDLFGARPEANLG